MARIEKTVFISYRRADVYTALAVYQDLSSKGYDVFFDYTSIPSGDFEQIIVSNIKARAHFLLILTPTALDRCSEPGDWLRREIETAMDEQRNIIPLFFKDFNFGSPSVSEKLTGKLGNLSRFNGLNVHEDYFQAAMDRLSRQFLSVPLEAILQPYSNKVRERVKEEQIAAENALEQKWEEIKEIFKPAKEKAGGSEKDQIEKTKNTPFSLSAGKSSNLRLYGIGASLLLVVALGLAGLNAWVNRGNEITPTMTSQVIENTISVEPSSTSPLNTATVEFQTSTPTAEPTLTSTPTPTLVAGSTKNWPKDGMVMVYVPAGTYKMGYDKGESDEQPIHDVYLDTFWIDQTEVTNKMYSACVQVGECIKPRDEVNYLKQDFEMHPVVHIDWYDAKAYCTWVGRRLPSEAEWEKAASWDEENQIKHVFPWGDNLNCSFANYLDTSQHCVGTTTAAGSYPKGKSPYTVLDMAGNVLEWVNDRYQKEYYGLLESLTSNPTGPLDGNLRILRGGSWNSYNYDIRSADRQRAAPTETSGSIGFRCTLSE